MIAGQRYVASTLFPVGRGVDIETTADVNNLVLTAVPYFAAFIAGALGGVHCIGMCGGVVGALVHGLPQTARGRISTLLPFVLSYNLGRVLSYAAGGAIAGYLGFAAADWITEYRSWFFLRIAAALLMIGLGLYIAGWWMGLTAVERLGARLWHRIRPIGNRLLPIRRWQQALLLGVLWGWLPCGLVYTVLVWSFAAGGWREGAMLMMSFGAGTMPLLVLLGVTTGRLTAYLQRRTVRGVAGLAVIMFGLWTLAATLVHQSNMGLGHTH